MNYDLQSHKRSDAVKWVIVFILIAVLFVGMVTSIVIGIRKDTPKEDVQEEEVVGGLEQEEAYAMPKLMSFTAEALSASETESVDVRIEAYVYPEDASNKQVDYSVAWGEAPTHGAEDVSDYLTVTQDADGSRLATVSCKKAFGEDKIIITVTTRDGGFTDTCTVSFVGIASEISISCDTLTVKTTTERGSYYELGTSRTYDFHVNLTNVLDAVAHDYEVTIGGVGNAYFGNEYWNDGGYSTFSDCYEQSLDSIASKVITSATITGDTLTVKTGSLSLTNLHGDLSTDEYYYNYYPDSYVTEDKEDYSGIKESGDSFYNSYAQKNAERVNGFYFFVTVTDQISGLTETIRLWVVNSVTSVMFSDETLTF